MIYQVAHADPSKPCRIEAASPLEAAKVVLGVDAVPDGKGLVGGEYFVARDDNGFPRYAFVVPTKL